MLDVMLAYLNDRAAIDREEEQAPGQRCLVSIPDTASSRVLETISLYIYLTFNLTHRFIDCGVCGPDDNEEAGGNDVFLRDRSQQRRTNGPYHVRSQQRHVKGNEDA